MRYLGHIIHESVCSNSCYFYHISNVETDPVSRCELTDVTWFHTHGWVNVHQVYVILTEIPNGRFCKLKTGSAWKVIPEWNEHLCKIHKMYIFARCHWLGKYILPVGQRLAHAHNKSSLALLETTAARGLQVLIPRHHVTCVCVIRGGVYVNELAGRVLYIEVYTLSFLCWSYIRKKRRMSTPYQVSGYPKRLSLSCLDLVRACNSNALHELEHFSPLIAVLTFPRGFKMSGTYRRSVFSSGCSGFLPQWNLHFIIIITASISPPDCCRGVRP